MELLLLLLPLGLLAVAFGGSGDDSDDGGSGGNGDGDGERVGTPGNDVIQSGAIDDTVSGGAGEDLIFGNRGEDDLRGEEGRDVLQGGLDDDLLSGGAGADLLIGDAGDDSLDGGTGEDLLMGGAGDDALDGGEGDDLLIGGSGADQLSGGAGDDVISSLDPVGAALARDLAELDTAVLRTALANRHGDDVTEAMLDRVVSGAISSDAVADGSAPPDTLRGGAGEDALFGDDGDTMTGGADEDRFEVLWQNGDDPVSITDYDTDAGESVAIQLPGAVPQNSVFGIRDATDASGTEIVLNGDVVARLAGVSASDVTLGNVRVLALNGAGFIAVRL